MSDSSSDGPKFNAKAIKAIVPRLKSKTIKSWVEKLLAGDYSINRILKGLQGTVADTRKMISNSASPEGGRPLAADAKAQLDKYHDALLVLSVLEGGGARNNANIAANVNAVRPVLTERINVAQRGKKNTRKLETAARTLSRKVEAAKSAASAAAERLAALERGEMPSPSARSTTSKAAKEVIPAERLAALIARYGRSEEKAAMMQKVMGKIEITKDTPKYISDIVSALESQVLRFSSSAKKRLLLNIRVQITKLEGARDLAESEGKLTAKTAAAYASKLKSLQRLMGLVEVETNVEVSNASKASASSTGSRRSRVHTRMTCKKLRHPCNSKIIVTKEQLKAAVDEIMEKGWATPIPGAAAASAAPTRAASPVANEMESD